MTRVFPTEKVSTRGGARVKKVTARGEHRVKKKGEQKGNWNKGMRSQIRSWKREPKPDSELNQKNVLHTPLVPKGIRQKRLQTQIGWVPKKI